MKLQRINYDFEFKKKIDFRAWQNAAPSVFSSYEETKRAEKTFNGSFLALKTMMKYKNNVNGNDYNPLMIFS